MKNYKKQPNTKIRADGLEIEYIGKDQDTDAYRIKVKKYGVEREGWFNSEDFVVRKRGAILKFYDEDLYIVTPGTHYYETHPRSVQEENDEEETEQG